jgi:hypothetical protein
MMYLKGWYFAGALLPGSWSEIRSTVVAIAVGTLLRDARSRNGSDSGSDEGSGSVADRCADASADKAAYDGTAFTGGTGKIHCREHKRCRQHGNGSCFFHNSGGDRSAGVTDRTNLGRMNCRVHA